MLRLKKVAITGGLSSGKSSVCRFLKDLGCYVVSADEVVHNLFTPNHPTAQKVIELLGQDVVIHGRVDRGRVAAKVFTNPDLLGSLEHLLHPEVMEEIERRYEEARKNPSCPLFVAEIPLLFEVQGEGEFDFVIAVSSKEEFCRERFALKTGLEATEYDRRMSRQLSPKAKAGRADFVLENNSSLNDLQSATHALFQKLT